MRRPPLLYVWVALIDCCQNKNFVLAAGSNNANAGTRITLAAPLRLEESLEGQPPPMRGEPQGRPQRTTVSYRTTPFAGKKNQRMPVTAIPYLPLSLTPTPAPSSFSPATTSALLSAQSSSPGPSRLGVPPKHEVRKLLHLFRRQEDKLSRQVEKSIRRSLL